MFRVGEGKFLYLYFSVGKSKKHSSIVIFTRWFRVRFPTNYYFQFFLMSLLFNLFLVVNIKKNTSMKYGQTTMLLVYDIHQCFVHEQHIILLRHGRPLAFSQSKSSPFHICRLLWNTLYNLAKHFNAVSW